MKLIQMGIVLITIIVTMEASAALMPTSCESCHKKLVAGKVVHPALDAGCSYCHSGIDTAKVPHTQTNKVVDGLSDIEPALCYQCHATFTGKTVHPALRAGCTFCHDPHSSPNRTLLVKPVPELCFICHAQSLFNRKHVHPPVREGKCLTCHNPHASGNIKLLIKAPEETCLQCHRTVGKFPHVIADSFEGAHPIGLPVKGKPAPRDPAQPDQPLSCISCHTPHSADSVRLYRYRAKKPFELCIYCHRKTYGAAPGKP
jgi:predicted CXXCH cytochrome family protein